MASMPFLSCKFFASQKTYEAIARPPCRDFGFAEFRKAKFQGFGSFVPQNSWKFFPLERFWFYLQVEFGAKPQTPKTKNP
jgi:hypothetical protein